MQYRQLEDLSELSETSKRRYSPQISPVPFSTSRTLTDRIETDHLQIGPLEHSSHCALCRDAPQDRACVVADLIDHRDTDYSQIGFLKQSNVFPATDHNQDRNKKKTEIKKRPRSSLFLFLFFLFVIQRPVTSSNSQRDALCQRQATPIRQDRVRAVLASQKAKTEETYTPGKLYNFGERVRKRKGGGKGAARFKHDVFVDIILSSAKKRHNSQNAPTRARVRARSNAEDPFFKTFPQDPLSRNPGK